MYGTSLISGVKSMVRILKIVTCHGPILKVSTLFDMASDFPFKLMFWSVPIFFM